MAHSLMGGTDKKVQVFTIEDGQQKALGVIKQDEPLELDDFTLAIGEIKRYTGFKAYHRPQMPVLFVGCMVTLAGLLWHFYHRSRTRSWKRNMDAGNA
jgi:cytochrome c biogenesis protein ResB